MYPYDQNNQQMYQQYANHADQGTYSQIPEQEFTHQEKRETGDEAGRGHCSAGKTS